jgi:hypothetical protein
MHSLARPVKPFRGQRRGLLFAATLAAVVSLIVPLTVGSQTPARAAVLPDGCGDLLVLGARGSGQPQSGVSDSASRDYDAGTGLASVFHRGDDTPGVI